MQRLTAIALAVAAGARLPAARRCRAAAADAAKPPPTPRRGRRRRGAAAARRGATRRAGAGRAGRRTPPRRPPRPPRPRPPRPPRAAAQAPKPFADVIKDAKETPGFFTLYAEGRQGLDRDHARAVRQAVLLLGRTSTRGLGENFLFGGADGRSASAIVVAVPQDRQHRAADRAERALLREGRHAARRSPSREAFTDSLLARGRRSSRSRTRSASRC